MIKLHIFLWSISTPPRHIHRDKTLKLGIQFENLKISGICYSLNLRSFAPSSLIWNVIIQRFSSEKCSPILAVKFTVQCYLEMSELYFVQTDNMYRIFFVFTNAPLITMLPIKDNVRQKGRSIVLYTWKKCKNFLEYVNWTFSIKLLTREN